MAEFSILHKYMRLTDQKYLDFIASEASSPAPPDQFQIDHIITARDIGDLVIFFSS
ncbi:unnamed protein product [Brassica napus]|uniref:(rape) hypothetical protein n=1 Tax=Brassica napus TaxID=3708 RepID=A0A816X6Y9_BRANA|nr:unnamed protein product [Brassica napus]